MQCYIPPEVWPPPASQMRVLSGVAQPLASDVTRLTQAAAVLCSPGWRPCLRTLLLPAGLALSAPLSYSESVVSAPRSYTAGLRCRAPRAGSTGGSAVSADCSTSCDGTNKTLPRCLALTSACGMQQKCSCHMHAACFCSLPQACRLCLSGTVSQHQSSTAQKAVLESP